MEFEWITSLDERSRYAGENEQAVVFVETPACIIVRDATLEVMFVLSNGSVTADKRFDVRR
jgi:hypothetical protein